MNILATNTLKIGIQNALFRLPDGDEHEHTGVIWTPSVKPAFDAFAEFVPDIFVGYVSDWNGDRGLRKCLKRVRPKVILFEDSQRPLKDVDDLVVNKHPIPIAIDPLLYRAVPADPKWLSEISFVNTTPNAEDDELIIPLCRLPGEHKVKLYGKPVSLCPQWCGHLSEEEKNLLFCSTTVNVVTPHTDPELVQQINGATAFAPLELEVGRDVFEQVNNYKAAAKPFAQRTTYKDILRPLIYA